MIVYDRLWKTMKEKNINQYRLIHDYHVSSSQLSRLRNNTGVSTHTLDMLCTILQCNIEDIIEFRYDPSQNIEFGIPKKLWRPAADPGTQNEDGDDIGIPVTPETE